MKWRKFPTAFCIQNFLGMNIGDQLKEIAALEWSADDTTRKKRQSANERGRGECLSNAATNFAIENFF